MSPTLRKARICERAALIGRTADEIQWWRQGVPLADGVRLWDRVTTRPAEQLRLAA